MLQSAGPFARRVFLIGLAATAALLLAGLAPTAASAGTLDQDVSCGGSPCPTSFTPGDGLPSAQTFTAGISGGLDQVDLLVNRDPTSCASPAALTVEIRTVNGAGTPTGTVLATSTIAAASVPVDSNPLSPPAATISATFTSPAAVSAGTQYAIVLSTTTSSCYDWWGSTSNPYAGGQAFHSVINTGFMASPTTDLVFRTYVARPALASPSKATCRGLPVTQAGTDAADTIFGTPGPDVIATFGGADTVFGLAGGDLICGGTGDDTLRGGNGDDGLFGRRGDDKLGGGPGADFCKGGRGNDTGKSCAIEKSV